MFVGVLFFNVLWGFIWYGVKTLLLRYVAGFSKEERRQSFSSRMRQPFDVAAFVGRHSERRIRIVDMIGRRGRFITSAMAGFFYLYSRVAGDPSPNFATPFLQDNLFDAVVTSWIFLAFYYSDGFLAAAFYGPQSRVMDGVLARANCLLITTLWTVFKFVMVPLGARLAAVFPSGGVRRRLRAHLGLVHRDRRERGDRRRAVRQADAPRVGHRRRQSQIDRRHACRAWSAALVFCLWIVLGHGLPAPWIGSRDRHRRVEHACSSCSRREAPTTSRWPPERADLLGVRRVRPVSVTWVTGRTDSSTRSTWGFPWRPSLFDFLRGNG